LKVNNKELYFVEKHYMIVLIYIKIMVGLLFLVVAVLDIVHNKTKKQKLILNKKTPERRCVAVMPKTFSSSIILPIEYSDEICIDIAPELDEYAPELSQELTINTTATSLSSFVVCNYFALDFTD